VSKIRAFQCACCVYCQLLLCYGYFEDVMDRNNDRFLLACLMAASEMQKLYRKDSDRMWGLRFSWRKLWRMLSSRMWRHVVCKILTYVSQERADSFIRVKDRGSTSSKSHDITCEKTVAQILIVSSLRTSHKLSSLRRLPNQANQFAGYSPVLRAGSARFRLHGVTCQGTVMFKWQDACEGGSAEGAVTQFTCRDEVTLRVSNGHHFIAQQFVYSSIYPVDVMLTTGSL
jgi:hypothetical protein